MNYLIRRTPNHPTKAFTKVLAAALLLLLMAGLSFGQKVTDGSTPSGLAPGAPAGSYALSGFDNVNLFNGHMNFRLPLLNVTGRGGAGYQMTRPVEQTWTIFRQENEITGVVSYYPEPNWWTTIKPGYGPGVLQGRSSGTGSGRCNEYSPYKYGKTLTRLTFTAGDGTEYEFRDKTWDGQPLNLSPCASTGNNRGKVFATADGSSATFISDADILDATYVDEEPFILSPSGYLLLRDGTRYRIDAGTVTWMRDRNGNQVSFLYDVYRRVTSVTDSLGRQIIVAYATQTPDSDVITYKGFGTVDRTISVNYDYMQNALRSDQALQTPKQLFPDTKGSSTTNYNPTVIKSVTLPDGRQYQLSYNSYGEVARATLPTGGAMEYDYAAGLTDGAASGSFGGGPNGKHVYRRVVERRVYPGGGSSSGYESKLTYSRPETRTTNAGYVITDQCTPSGTTGQCGGAPALLGRQHHYFSGSARSSFYQNAVSYGSWTTGREYQTDVYDANGTTLLRRTVNTYAQRDPSGWWTSDSCCGTPPNDPRLVETVTTLADTGQVTKQTFGYSPDLHNNQTDVWEYDYGAGAPPAYPVRHTHIDFLTINPANNINYAGPANGASYTSSDVHIRSLPRQSSVYDAAGVEQSRQTFEYDNYAIDTNHTALVDRSGITGLDAGFTTSYQTRGNVTAATGYLLTNGAVTGTITTYAQYDVAGHTVKAIDGRGQSATVDYADSFADGVNRNTFAFPTHTTSPIPDPTNVRATNTALISTSVYDFATGRVTATKDANGQVNGLSTTYGYNDVMGRLTKVNSPDAGWTDYFYNDTVGSLYVRTRTAMNASQSVESYQFFDGLGRAVRSFVNEGGSPRQVHHLRHAVRRAGAGVESLKFVSHERLCRSGEPGWPLDDERLRRAGQSPDGDDAGRRAGGDRLQRQPGDGDGSGGEETQERDGCAGALERSL